MWRDNFIYHYFLTNKTLFVSLHINNFIHYYFLTNETLNSTLWHFTITAIRILRVYFINDKKLDYFHWIIWHIHQLDKINNLFKNYKENAEHIYILNYLQWCLMSLNHVCWFPLIVSDSYCFALISNYQLTKLTKLMELAKLTKTTNQWHRPMNKQWWKPPHRYWRRWKPQQSFSIALIKHHDM